MKNHRKKHRIFDPINITVKAVRRLNGKPYSGQRTCVLELAASEKLMRLLFVEMKIGTLRIIAVHWEDFEIVVRNDQSGPITLKPGDTAAVMRR